MDTVTPTAHMDADGDIWYDDAHLMLFIEYARLLVARHDWMPLHISPVAYRECGLVPDYSGQGVAVWHS